MIIIYSFERIFNTFSGNKISVIYTKNAPSKNPNTTGINAKNLLSPFNFSPISKAGNNNDQKEAAIITPLANPRLASRKDLFFK